MDKTKYKKYKITAICFLLVVSFLLIGAENRKQNRQNAEITFFEKETQSEIPEIPFYEEGSGYTHSENASRNNLTTSTGPEDIIDDELTVFGAPIENDGEGPKLININTATSEELQELYRIGPALAERIIAYRNCYGLFETLEEIKEVEGIGDATYEKLKAWITVENH